MKTFSKKEAFIVGWNLFKKHPLFLMGLFLLTSAISYVSTLAITAVGTGNAQLLLNSIDFFIQTVIGIGLLFILFRIYDGEKTNYFDLLKPLHLFWKYLAATFFVVIIIGIGLLLLIVPGVIAGIALSFALYSIVDTHAGPVEAIKESVRITRGHRWNILLFGIFSLLLNIVGALVFGIGLFITIPVTALASVHVYRWLSDPSENNTVVISIVTKVATVIGILLFTVLLLGVMVAYGK